MSGLQGMAYAQARIQSRFGDRVKADVWLKLHNIHDLGNYLQTAQQTPLRHWVLGISSTHSGHEIELTLRRKFRLHVAEVAGWMPVTWQKPVRAIGSLPDLPVLQYLASGGEALQWMKTDPELEAFTGDDTAQRLRAMRDAGLAELVDAWQRQATMLEGWLLAWNRNRPHGRGANHGLVQLEKLLAAQLGLQQQQQAAASHNEYDDLFAALRILFRRYAFLPAGACAYLAIIALDLHRLRGDLLRRLYFQRGPELADELAA